MTLRDMIVKFGFVVDESSQKKAENSIKSIKSVATKLLGTLAIGFSLKNMNALAEEFNGINGKIKNATKELGDQEEIQKKLLQSANDLRMSYGNTATAVSNLVQNSNGLFGSVDDAVEFNNLTTKVFKTARKSEAEITSLQDAMNKSFAKGTVDVGTINQLIEKSPDAVRYLNKQLGTTTEGLQKMASAGKISLSDLRDAFTKNADEIDKNFDDLDYSLSDAFLNIRNQWGLFCDSLWTGAGIGNSVGKMMVRAFTSLMDLLKKLQPTIEKIIKFALSGVRTAMDLITRLMNFIGRIVNRLGGVEKVLKLLAIVAGAVWVALNAGKILSFLKDMGKLLTGINLKVMALIAVIVLIALIVEDFIAFMKGDDSVIGEIFKRAGIDADEVREKILAAWGKIKEFLTAAWEFLKNLGKKTAESLKQFWNKNGDSIKSTALKVWNFIWNTLKRIWNNLSKLATQIFNGLKDFWAQWGDEIQQAFGVLWEGIKSIIQIALDAILALVNFWIAVFSGDWEGAWQYLKEFVSSIWEGIKTVISTVLQIIWIFIQDKVNSIKEKFLTTFTNIKTGISNKMGAIKTTITTKLSEAIKFITDLPSKAITWGEDFIDGLIQGIKNKIGAVKDAVKGVAETITSYLHFSVPDEGPLTKYESWMPDFMQGLAKGIKGNENLVLDRVKSLAGNMAMFAKAANANVAAAAGTVSNRSTNITQNNTFQNSYSGGERQTQANVSKGMNQSATDATKLLARGLAYSI